MPSWPLVPTITPTPPATVTPRMPAIKWQSAFRVPMRRCRLARTPPLPNDIVTAGAELAPASSPNAMLLSPVAPASASTPLAVLLLPVVLSERISTVGRVEVAGCVVWSAIAPVAVFWLPVVLLWSALAPLAVLVSPVVLLKSASKPVAVLMTPVCVDCRYWN